MNRLSNQVQEILDTRQSDSLEVLVQMEVADRRVAELVRLSSRAVQARQSILSARDLVPPPLPELLQRREKASRSRNVRTQSLGPYPLDPSLGHRTSSQAIACGQQALKALLDWAGKKPSHARKQNAFPASGSALLTVSADELAQLPKQVDDIVGIYRNQRITVPPVAVARGVPEVVRRRPAHAWGLSRSGAMACWGAFNARGAGIKVAVLDTGVDPNHPDLAGKIADFAEFDGKGKIVRSGVAHCYDSGSHGTHVAGSIVGGNASGRWVGMAPEAKILAGLVLKKGAGTDAQILAGMQWALNSGADVISMSLGGMRLSPEVQATYTQMIISANLQGVPVVVAIGNEGAQTSGSPGNDYFAFTVGATDVEDRAAGFSGGRTQIVQASPYIDAKDLPLVYSKPDVTAPGVDVYSCVPKGKYDIYSGTSMATPHVAGAMALLLGNLGGLRKLSGWDKVASVQHLLLSSVKELGEAGHNHRFGHGRLDVLQAYGLGLELGY